MAATAPLVRDSIDALEALREFRELDGIQTFLANNLDLFDLLVKASSKILEFLPPTDRSFSTWS